MNKQCVKVDRARAVLEGELDADSKIKFTLKESAKVTLRSIFNIAFLLRLLYSLLFYQIFRQPSCKETLGYQQ